MPPKTKTEPEDSDYDELEEDAELDPKEDPNVFKIREPLQPPRSSTYSLGDLHRDIHQGLIDLSPPYQRDVVWPDAKQVMLVDSLWRNYHIPPIIFAVVEDDGETVRRCVDGKQRLTSIIRFIDGQIHHVDPITRRKWYFTKPQSKTSQLEIPANFKSRFEKKQITCIEYYDLNDETERDIFQRVQLGMSLSSAEKQKAIYSPWTVWFDELVTTYVSQEDGIPSYIKWNTKRERDFQCIALLVMVCYYLPDFHSATPSKLKTFIATPELPSDAFKAHIRQVLSIFQTLVSTSEFRTVIEAASPILAPIEFVYVGALISQVKVHASAGLAGMIYQFRNHIRSIHKDIRMNDRLSKSMYDYIIKLNVPAGLEEAESVVTPSKKRRRGARDDDEYRPGRDGNF